MAETILFIPSGCDLHPKPRILYSQDESDSSERVNESPTFVPIVYNRCFPVRMFGHNFNSTQRQKRMGPNQSQEKIISTQIC